MSTPERLDVARELHDGIAQDLVALGYSLDLLLATDGLPQSARSSIRESRLQVDELMRKVRSEIFNLRSQSQQSISTQLQSLFSQEYSDFELELDIESASAPPEVGHEIISIAREILRNVRLHSRATRIGITLYPVNNRIYLQICDNGIGGAIMKDGRWGMTGISERIAKLGGSIVIENNSDTDLGVRITLLL
jgi:two-component system, NarL family, sensor histidine kinase LiaS|uniref:sensor histidine kinase n=1 Tax=Candidatus Planktophila sp. TaxID=2175601 RepID=UPI00404B78D5